MTKRLTLLLILLVVVILCCGCGTVSTSEKPLNKIELSPDRYEWKKLNELKDNAGNKVCAYKINGDSEWWDIIVVYDKDDNIKQVISKQFRN